MVTHMKTTVEIATPLLVEAKRIAKRDGVTLRELIDQGLRRALDDRNAAARKPYVLKDCSNKAARLQPWIREGDWNQLRDAIYGFDDPQSRMGRLIKSLGEEES